MLAVNVIGVDLLFLKRASNLININVNHFPDKILSVYFFEDDFVACLGVLHVFDVDDGQQYLRAGEEEGELGLGLLMNA